MTPELIGMLIASGVLFLIGFILGEERGKGEPHERTDTKI